MSSNQTPASGTTPEIEPRLTGRAMRIRELVNMARGAIIEIGRELIQASDEVEHGLWLDWLRKNFGWSETTARRYMNIAEAFGAATQHGRFDLEISFEARALYALASPDVPQAARDEAIALAESGERITRDQAEEMVKRARLEAAAEAVAEERRKAQSKLADTQTEMQVLLQRINNLEAEIEEQVESRLGEVVRSAKSKESKEIREARAALAEARADMEEARLRAERLESEMAVFEDPTDDLLIRLTQRLTNRKPSKPMLQALAQALGKSITFEGRSYDAAEPLATVHAPEAGAEDPADHDRSVAPWQQVLDAMQAINALPPVDDLFADGVPDIDPALRAEVTKARFWVMDFMARWDASTPAMPALKRRPLRRVTAAVGQAA